MSLTKVKLRGDISSLSHNIILNVIFKWTVGLSVSKKAVLYTKKNK